MSTERDTHFKEFAKLLYQELSELSSEVIISEDLNEREKQEILRIIAKRAYDLVLHTIHEIGMDSHAVFHDDLCTPEDVPDMTTWPEQSE